MSQTALSDAIVAISIAVEDWIILAVLRASAGTQVALRVVIGQDTAWGNVRLRKHNLLDFRWGECLTLTTGKKHASKAVAIGHLCHLDFLRQSTRLLGLFGNESGNETDASLLQTSPAAPRIPSKSLIYRVSAQCEDGTLPLS